MQTQFKVLADREGEAQPLKICFVCTGNTCRSPMAAAVANAMAAKELEALPASVRESAVPVLDAISRGLYAAVSSPISAHAVAALEGANIEPTAGRDYHDHTARNLTETDADTADWLVAMSQGHAMEILMRFPQAAQKIICMPHPISDPYGGDLAVYQTCLDEITAGVRELLQTRFLK